MSRRERRKFTATFKTKVILESPKERKTMSELAQQFDLHPNQITTWKKDFLAGATKVFEVGADPEREALQQKQDELYQQIGRLQVENEWKKSAEMSRTGQRLLVARGHQELTIGEQCALLGLLRSTLDYKPRPATEEDLRIMRLTDELHLENPARGTRRLCDELVDLGIRVGRDKVRTLMRRMRMACVYRRPRTTVLDKAKYKHPYLLRGLKIERAHQVWGIDITYTPMRGGYMYMCAIIDLYSRYIVGWSISNTMEAEWVCAVVRDAVAAHGNPEIINSDQGRRFTSDEYRKVFKEGQPCQGVRISMDGKGRAIDKVVIERFCRTLKDEHIYLRPPEDSVDLCQTCSQFIHFYNHRRKHSDIGKVPPVKRLPMAA